MRILFFANHKKNESQGICGMTMAFCATADNSRERTEPASSNWQHEQVK